MSTTQYPPMTRDRLSGIAHLGVTILGTSNRNNPLKYSVMRSDGTLEEVDRSDEIEWGFADRSIEKSWNAAQQYRLGRAGNLLEHIMCRVVRQD